jgi:uncharacterized protein with HEPN domain
MTTGPKDNLRLEHIVDAADHVAEFIFNVSKEEFDNNYEKQSAIIRQFEIIGEAANNLSPEFKAHYGQIDWPKVIGMRHKMIHDYFDVDTDIVWNTANDDVKPLKQAIEKILTDSSVN